jgi:hypothetical protein
VECIRSVFIGGWNADKFTLARKPLNYMVEHFISGYRTELFS